MSQGFGLIAEARAVGENWDLEENKRSSWAIQMAKRMQKLLRHCSQAAAQSTFPSWLSMSIAGGMVEKLKQELAEIGETQRDDESEDDAENAESEEVAPRSPVERPAEPTWVYGGYAADTKKAYRYRIADPKKKRLHHCVYGTGKFPS